MKQAAMIGRMLFSIIFLMTLVNHFKPASIAYAEVHGVPFASILVPISGIIAFLGGTSIFLGYKTKIGAWLIILFLIPVTFFMHAFWNETDPMMMQQQMSHFLSNLSLIGGAFFFSYIGAGPISLDHKITHEKKVHYGKQGVRVNA